MVCRELYKTPTAFCTRMHALTSALSNGNRDTAVRTRSSTHHALRTEDGHAGPAGVTHTQHTQLSSAAAAGGAVANHAAACVPLHATISQDMAAMCACRETKEGTHTHGITDNTTQQSMIQPVKLT
jgi:hypothetical protein